jgi:WYL domain
MRAKREHALPRDHQKLERLKFIDEELFWVGEVTRRLIEEVFAVSEETAKVDLRDYREGYGSDLKPDPHDNIYRVPIEFLPRLSRPEPESYLDRLARRALEALPIATVPDVDRRTIDRTILQSVIRAIRKAEEIEILYRSPRAEAPRRYRIFPHALLHDGFRWSVRCYMRRDAGGYWGEMVLDRIEEVFAQTSPADPAMIDGDAEWQAIVELELVPNPGLDLAARSLIEEQYEMNGGVKVVRVRQCMLAYFLKRYQLEEPTTLLSSR